jgi:cyclophilin family peptidyl-prolyl cis-trans isomerase
MRIRIPAALAVLFVALAAAPLAAQGAKTGKGGRADAPPAAQAPKDDAVTAKDKLIAELDRFAAKKKVSKKRADWRTALAEPPKQSFAADRDYFWHLKTNKGEITVRLFGDTAPMHATSVIYLARQGFYDGIVFHRVIKSFMAQGGCPLGNGTGDPGYRMDGEYVDTVKFDRPGLLGAANSGAPRTDGSQFFITFVPTPHLDGKHTIFGEVTEGMDVVKALEDAGGGDDGKTSEPLAIECAWIVVVPREAAGGAK